MQKDVHKVEIKTLRRNFSEGVRALLPVIVKIGFTAEPRDANYDEQCALCCL